MKATDNTFHVSRFTFHLFVLIPLLIFFVSCSREEAQISPSWDVKFFPLGAKIHFDRTNREKVQRVRVFDITETGGMMVARLDLGGYSRSTESVYFQWEKGMVYRFEVTGEAGEPAAKTVRTPQLDLQGSIEVAIPYGIVEAEGPVAPESGPDRLAESLVLQGSNMTMTVLIRNGMEAPVEFEVGLNIPAEIEVLQPSSVWKSGTNLSAPPPSPHSKGGGRKKEVQKTRLSTSGRFTIESDVWYSQLALKISEEPLPLSTQIHGHVHFENASGDSWERQTAISLHSATVDEIGAQLSIEDVLMPTNAAGVFDSRQRPDAISYPRPLFGRFGKWLGAEEAQFDYFQPISHQSVRLRNDGQNSIHVVVSAVNRDPKSGKPIPFLAPPDAINAGTDRSLAFVSLTGQSTTDVPLPIYFNPSGAERRESSDFAGAGRYEREIEVKVWGSDATVLRVKRPLRIVTPNLHALFVTACAFAGTVLGIFFLLRFHQSLFSHFSTKQLILIALFGTTIFVAVSIPSTLLSNLVSVLFGPIAFLITGLINEMLYYALLTSLLMLIPKPGVITLVSAVRLLLGGVTLGLFNPMTLVYTSVSILLLEVGFQITRKGSNLLLLALAFGVCDALTVYVDFQLSMTLYRLFYANWFIFTRLLVDGFTYTFIGVLLGRRMGRGLWQVAE